ncbi:MAG: hypothetical protein ACK521_07570 [bacterium]
MTTATQIKPNTPLTKFFSNGEYATVPVKDKVLHNAEPDQSARLRQRNPDKINGEMNVKSVTQSNIDIKAFNPRNYIKPHYIHDR